MKKKLLFAGAVLGALTIGFGALTTAAGGTLKTPESELTIDGKKPARFSHLTHLQLKLECGVCHHDAEHKALTADAIAGMTAGKQLKCVSCHNSTFANQALQTPKDVFHARCKECHKTGHEGKIGPTGCTDCHLKKATKAVEGC